MNHVSRPTTWLALSALLTVGACATPAIETSQTMGTTAAAALTPVMLVATLSGASEVPAVATDAAGKLVATLDAASNVLTWKVTYSGLSGVPTMAHFHGPALAGQNAGVVVPINGALTSPITGSVTLTPSQAADLAAGKWYVNLHTAASPGGEARGQVNLGL
jgi:hypothetical protein